MYRYFNRLSGVGNGNYNYFWKSKGLLDENITAPTTSDFKLNPEYFFGTKTRVKFDESCLKQDKITYNHGKLVSIYILYEISKSFNISYHPTKENCLFSAVSLNRNAETNKYKYFGYGIGFDRHRFGIYLIICGVDMSFWSRSEVNKIDNNKKYILILGKGSHKD